MSKFYKVINRKGEVKLISEFIYNTPRLMARHGYQPIPEPEKAKVTETDDLSDAKIEDVSVFEEPKKTKRKRRTKEQIERDNLNKNKWN